MDIPPGTAAAAPPGRRSGGRVCVSMAFQEAATAFKGWWLPLCLLAGGLLASQAWLPHRILGNLEETRHLSWVARRLDAFQAELAARGAVALARHPEAATDAVLRLHADIASFLARDDTAGAIASLKIKLGCFFLALLALLSGLHVCLVLVSKASVWRNRPEVRLRKSFRSSGRLTASYMVLTLVKLAPFLVAGLPAALWLRHMAGALADPHAPPPGLAAALGGLAGAAAFAAAAAAFGVYLYVRLYFTCFLITEESANPFRAMAASWRLSRGNVAAISLLFAMNLAVDLFGALTILGFIPGTAFNYTLRAAAYQQCLRPPTGG